LRLVFTGSDPGLGSRPVRVGGWRSALSRPTHHENVHFYGTHSVDIDGELAQFDADGYPPLRPAEVATE
jgi:hypothetical protein